MSIRILIADNHDALRAGLRALMSGEADLEVVGEAVDGSEALRLADELRPGVVLLDLTLPGPGGIQVTRQLSQSMSQARVLILSVHEDAILAREALQAGAAGYLIKRAVESELINAIRAVDRGDVYIHSAVTRALLQEAPPRRAPTWRKTGSPHPA